MSGITGDTKVVFQDLDKEMIFTVDEVMKALMHESLPGTRQSLYTFMLRTRALDAQNAADMTREEALALARADKAEAADAAEAAGDGD